MKKFLALTAVCLLAFTMACDSGSSAKEGNEEDASMMYLAVQEGINEAYIEAVNQAMYPQTKSSKADPVNIDWTNEPGSITVKGNWTNNGIDYITITLEITFDNFVASDGTVVNGSTTYSYEGTYDENNLFTSFTYSVNGEFVVNYKGTDYDFAWNMEISCTESIWAYSGNFTIEGETYSYSGSGVAKK